MGCRPVAGQYTLIIAEKSKAAKSIAYSISARPVLCKYKGVPYWMITRDGDYIVIAPVSGHLFSLYTDEKGFPVFRYNWAPRWEVEKGSSYTKKFFELLEILSNSPKLVINACDYDIEGSVIGYLVISKVVGVKSYKRMKFSSLTADELRTAFYNLLPQDTSMVEAGLCRHELDWIYGINLSRFLMYIYNKSFNQRRILSIGRVQTPTLVEVVDRYIKTQTYVKPPLFNICASIAFRDEKIHACYTGNPVSTFENATKVKRIIEKAGNAKLIKIERSRQQIPPPPPFNLNDLQDEAYRKYGFSPSYTQKIAEDLYLNGLISYPRTNSQKLPPSLNIDKILRSLAKIDYKEIVDKIYRQNPNLTYREGRKTDPAHPAIYPTGIPPGKIDSTHRKIYDLIVRRFLASFLPPATSVILRITWEAGVMLESVDSYLIDEGWLITEERYKVRKETVELFRTGEIGIIKKVSIKEVHPDKPLQHTKSSVLKWMVSNNIGTESTRGEIIELLYKRKYLEEHLKKSVPTLLGIVVSEIAKQFFPELTSINLTRQFEEKIEKVRGGVMRKEAVVEEAKNVVKNMIKKGIESEGEIVKMMRALLNGEGKRCPICGQPAVDTLCIIHRKALENLKDELEGWIKAFGVERDEAIKLIYKSKEIGNGVREVARKIINKEIII